MYGLTHRRLHAVVMIYIVCKRSSGHSSRLKTQRSRVIMKMSVVFGDNSTKPDEIRQLFSVDEYTKCETNMKQQSSRTCLAFFQS